MLRRSMPFLLLVLASSLAGNVGAQFTSGNLVIYELGGGGGIPINGAPITIREFTPGGTPATSVALPTTGDDRIYGGATGTTGIQLTPLGDRLVVAGYGVQSAIGTPIGQSAGSAVPRVVGTLNANGTFTRQFSSSTLFSGAAVNGAASDGVNFWVVGSAGGVGYFGPGAQAVVASGIGPLNEIAVAAGQLSVSNTSTGGTPSLRGIQNVGAGLPTTSGQVLTNVINPTSLSAGFSFNPARTVCYIAATTGVQKWTFNGSTWSLAYTLSGGGNTAIARLTVDHVAQPAIVYATNSQPAKLLRWIDSGAGATVTELATGTGSWQGIAFAPGTCPEDQPCDDGDPNTINDMIRGNCVCAGVSVPLNARVLLEGPYNAAALMMNDALRTLAEFPLTEPYTALGLPPTGGATTINPGILSTAGNDALVDWILVETRDDATGGTVLSRTAGLVQRDGDIVGLDGSAALRLPVVAGTYHVAVRHRNHLGVMTAAPLTLNSLGNALDLTLADTPTWGTDARKNVAGVLVLRAGEVLRNGSIAYVGANNDRDPILVVIGSTTPNNIVPGYRVADVNMDGLTQYTGAGNDRDPILVNVGSTTPNNLRFEQLP
jgi:hypothetical protein